MHTFKYEHKPDCLICSRKPVDFSVTPDTTLQKFLETLTTQLQLSAPSTSSSNGILYICKPAALEKLHHCKLELEQLLSQGLFTSGEPIIVTDSSIEGSVTIKLTVTS